MSKIKIIQVKARTPEERKNKIEEVQNLNPNIICKGSTYFEVTIKEEDGEDIIEHQIFYADIYFVQGETPIIMPNQSVKPETSQKAIQNNKPKENTTKDKNYPKEPFIPTKKLLEKWKNQTISKATYGLLLSKGYTKKDIKNMGSQLNAYYAIKNLEKENI